MEFAMACALTTGRAGPAELRDDLVRSAQVQALMKRVSVRTDDREDPEMPGRAPYDMVIVETADKRRVESAKVKHVRGGPELPLERTELWTKFEGCLRLNPPPFGARELFDALMALDEAAHVNDIPGLQR
jgi:2-methylcitrate dehydratase PrpD